MKNLKTCFLIFLWIGITCCSPQDQEQQSDSSPIQPWTHNPSYWQYKGQPTLLLGATDNDNLFQNTNLRSHLDSLQAIGGNYVRNTMSDRDQGDLRAFAKNEEGKYDLNQWNDNYWEKFENLLKWAEERDIIVQIEIWDRFDHSTDNWLSDPYNPGNNVNYTFEESGLDSIYPNHPGSNEQPFFFTVPALDDNKVLLTYQEAFVNKLLSISLNYDNVLYCIDNETKGEEEWAVYWADYIHESTAGKEVYLTQMWDDWDIKSDMHKRTLDHPDRYLFIDMSQNSHNKGQLNFDNAKYIFDYVKDDPRPINSTKIYGSDDHDPWLNRGMTTQHAVNTFFRNILGGFASSRFHRPPHGLGLSKRPIQSIKTVRKIEEKVKMWEVSPRMDLLSEVEDNEAFLAADEGNKYLVFFPKGGEVKLDLSQHKNTYEVRWMDIQEADWKITTEIEGGDYFELKPPIDSGSLAVILKK